MEHRQVPVMPASTIFSCSGEATRPGCRRHLAELFSKYTISAVPWDRCISHACLVEVVVVLLDEKEQLLRRLLASSSCPTVKKMLAYTHPAAAGE